MGGCATRESPLSILPREMPRQYPASRVSGQAVTYRRDASLWCQFGQAVPTVVSVLTSAGHHVALRRRPPPFFRARHAGQRGGGHVGKCAPRVRHLAGSRVVPGLHQRLPPLQEGGRPGDHCRAGRRLAEQSDVAAGAAGAAAVMGGLTPRTRRSTRHTASARIAPHSPPEIAEIAHPPLCLCVR